MTRIISGSAGGRRLKTPTSGARPTTDRVRESLFSNLDHYFGTWEGMRILDLFAGSGALGLEALSRGAAEAVFVDQARGAIQVIKENLATTRLGPAKVIQANAVHWPDSARGTQFDCVFLDPPYEDAAILVPAAVKNLLDARLIADDGVVITEHPTRTTIAWPANPRDITVRSFGDTSVSRVVW